MGRFRILPYKQGSRGARALADALEGKLLRLHGSTFVPRPDDVIINWGNTDPFKVHWPGAYPRTILNLPNQVRNASNKLSFFNIVQDEGLSDFVPAFWTDPEDVPDEAFPIVCRTVLNGHSGEGIVIANTRDELVNALLYTQYINKQDEYRIHLGRMGVQSNIISQQRKAKRRDCENPNWQIRNHQNGFVYVRNNVNPPSQVIDAATAVFEAVGLDFGAVDVIWNEGRQKAYVLEINTAPGLEGRTVEDYAEFFRSL